MLVETIRDTLAAAATPAALKAVMAEMWVAYGQGHVTEAAAAALQDTAEARKAALAAEAEARALAARARASKALAKHGSAPRTPESTLRRRRWMAGGWLPPAVAETATPAQAAVLAVVAWEASRSGTCRLAVGAIAALAGVSETSARNAIRAARKADFLTVTERRRAGQRSLTNILVVKSDEWARWLQKRRPRGGCKSPDPTSTDSLYNKKHQQKQHLAGKTSNQGHPRDGRPSHALNQTTPHAPGDQAKHPPQPDGQGL